jgi:hypothetical protein
MNSWIENEDKIDNVIMASMATMQAMLSTAMVVATSYDFANHPK